jgi:hypothetical protein
MELLTTISRGLVHNEVLTVPARLSLLIEMSLQDHRLPRAAVRNSG